MHRTPLPLSLDPLEDESLPGYLLRLSRRLEHAPARIMFLTGLTATGSSADRARLSAMVRLDPETAAVFSATTRLTPEETSALGLNAFASRYPYATPSYRTRGRRTPAMQPERWLFTTATRYCPRCLAGDGSPIQEEHGGPWRRSWRLPPVFACSRHRVFLQHLCPHCRQPAHLAPGTSSRLLARIKDHRLHPLQCRTTLPATDNRPFDPPSCGTRFDTTTNTGPPPTPEQLAFQDRLFTVLSAGGPAQVPSIGTSIRLDQYFLQIRWLSSLLSSTWPAGAELISDSATRDAVTAVVDERRERAHNRSTRRQEFSEHDAPPLDAHACAGLLEAAVRITDQKTRADAHSVLEPIATGQGWKSAWGRRYLMDEPAIQTELRLALEPLILVKPTRPARRNSIARKRSYGAEHIPARIPQDWYDRHFRHLDLTGMTPRVFRRAISVRLYQEATGQPSTSAPDFFRHHRRHFAPGAVTALNRWLRNTKNPKLFDEALAGLIAELETEEHLVNYQRRRDRMHNWQLADPDWEAIDRCLPKPRSHLEKFMEWEQPAASTYVWCLVTEGERTFAPWVTEGGKVERIHQVMRNLRYAKAHRRHRPLLDILTTLASRMTSAIDAAERGPYELSVHPVPALGGSR